MFDDAFDTMTAKYVKHVTLTLVFWQLWLMSDRRTKVMIGWWLLWTQNVWRFLKKMWKNKWWLIIARLKFGILVREWEISRERERICAYWYYVVLMLVVVMCCIILFHMVGTLIYRENKGEKNGRFSNSFGLWLEKLPHLVTFS